MPSFHIEQFGCRATQADGAAIERQLRGQGCSPADDPDAADVVVLNTCTVTASADAQARDAIRKIHAVNPNTRIIVTGCYAQRAPEELAGLPGVSHVVGNSHKSQISALLQTIAPVAAQPNPEGSSEFIEISQLPPYHAAPILTGNIFELTDVLVAPVMGGEGNHTRPTLKIQDGCNSRCSFCVIPFVRGKSRSLPPQTVIAEIQRLADSGFREIVLSGIHLGAYGRDLTPRSDFLVLLQRILDETPVERLRISSIEPMDVTQDLIDLFASSDRIARHFHMPLQSASDRILAAMHRWYRAGHYARRIELIQESLPNAAIGADVITGFPGETETDHETTLQFIEERKFTYLHVFSYSSRPGTKAASLPGKVPGHIIKRRARELRALGDTKNATFRDAQISRTLHTLTLHPSEECSARGLTPALTSNYLQVHLPAVLPANLFVNAKIIGTFAKALLAESPILNAAELLPAL
ncbi:MAG: tRNA (N(6)-L-threonylcarbamoyladenosine(37)-C(2))-methylthiotransferase MtaB [Candidatus Acidiferrum sp.]